MIPNNKTKVFISISSTPGNTGARFHNYYYKKYNLNNIYIPLKLHNLSNIRFLKDSNMLAGCLVSMPFKQKILKHVDQLDYISKRTNSVNTIKILNRKLIGYNTDYFGLKKILQKYKINNKKSVLLLGNGGMANTINILLKDLKFQNTMYSSRSKKKYVGWKIKNKKLINWKERGNFKNFNLLINATPIGMWNKNYLPISKKYLKNFEIIVDCAVNDNSPLKKECKKLKKKYISGKELSYYQALKQFKIYTGISIKNEY